MSAIITFDFKKSDIAALEANDRGYVQFAMSVNDDTNQYGQNTSVTVNQSKEDREAKQPKKYVGNGRVVWTDGSIVAAERVERGTPAAAQSQSGRETPDLPF